METQNTGLIDDEMYEFIAAADDDGLVAVELDTIERIGAVS
jgi:hypothetical protein